MKNSAFVGVDVGATSISALAIDEMGDSLAIHQDSGANAFTIGQGGRSLEDALGSTFLRIGELSSTRRIEAVVVGLAGLLAEPRAQEIVVRIVASAGIDVSPLVVNDSETVFATGSLAADGYCLAVGTGAIGVEIRDRGLVKTVDGHGWLFGDSGSAVWIGIEAIRAALRALDGGAESTSLVQEVRDALEVLTGNRCPPEPRRIVAAAHSVEMSALGRIAPRVDAQAQRGDEAARRILDEAAEELAQTLMTLVGDNTTLPIVLGGSIPSDNSRIQQHLQQVAQDKWPAAPVHVARSGAPGAAVWALRNTGRLVDQGILERANKAFPDIETNTRA